MSPPLPSGACPCSQGGCSPRPALQPQRARLSVSDAGTESQAWKCGISAAEAPWGWDIALRTTLAASARVTGTLKGGYPWEDAPEALSIGPFDVNSGGRIYVPAPVFSLTATDALASSGGNTSYVDCWALPRARDGGQLGATCLHGRTSASVAAGGSTSFDVPSGATGYRVIPESSATAPFAISAKNTPSGGAAETWESWTLDPASATDSAGGAQGGAWH